MPPIHSYKSWVGVAADRVNATLTSSINASVTSLPISNIVGTPGSSYTAIIIDGVNTEAVACSSSVSGGAITVASTAHAHSANTYVTFQLTASVGPTAYIPAETFTPEDSIAQLLDTSYRGSAVTTVGIVEGMRNSSWTIAGGVFADTVGYLLGGLFGSEDFVSATPNTHTFAVLNTGTFEPVPYTFYNYDGANTRIFAGGKIQELTLTLDPKALMKYSCKYMSRASGVVTTPTSSFSTLPPTPSWVTSMTVNSAAVVPMTFDIVMTREQSEHIETLAGIQDPYAVWAGSLKATGTVKYVKPSGASADTQLLNFLTNGVTPPVVLTSTSPGYVSPVTGLSIQMTQCNYMTAKVIEQGASFVTEEFTYEAISNATDANTAGAGLSPCRVVLSNAINGTTYT